MSLPAGWIIPGLSLFPCVSLVFSLPLSFHVTFKPTNNYISSCYYVIWCCSDCVWPEDTSKAAICTFLNKHNLFTFSDPNYSTSVLSAHTLYPYPSLYVHLSSSSILTTVCSACSQVLQWQQTTDGDEYWMGWWCCVMEAGWMRLDKVKFALSDPIQQLRSCFSPLIMWVIMDNSGLLHLGSYFHSFGLYVYRLW